MQIEIKHRYTNAVLFTAELGSEFDRASFAIQLGQAIRQAVNAGADLTDAYLRGANLAGADLRGADLRGANLTDADLTRAYLADADLTRANLTEADLADADLTRANLTDAYLTRAYLTDAVPIIPQIHQTVYAAATANPDAFDMSDWHKCDTTHCRAGWVTTLAGEAGSKLETALGPSVAAALIYFKSDPSMVRVPDFQTTNEKALDDMKAMAEAEAKSCL